MQMDQDRGTDSAKVTEQRLYYCRGCGGVLAGGDGSHFHPECLRSDKRQRVREQRRRQQEKFQKWLNRQRCVNCGVRYGEQGPNERTGAVCEASQPAREVDLSVERG